MLTYPRFAKACYAFFAVAVLAAVLKLSVSGAELSLLRMLPAAPTASAVERAFMPPQGPEDPRLESFSDDGRSERVEAAFSRSSSRTETLRGSEPSSSSSVSFDASVFRRPSLEGDPSEPVCGDLGDAPGSSRAVFPLPDAYFNSYDDTWGAARPQGGHEGSDLMSPAGTPEFAITDGRLVAVAGSNENGWNKLGGYTVMLEAAYSVGPIKKGDLFYYAHLNRESALPVGTEVRAGQRIGTVGDTGEGPEVTRGLFPSHLHLGWYDAELSESRSEAESGAMNPYPLLLWLEENGGAVSGGTDARYCQAPQGPDPTPSTGEPDWPIPAASGLSPDLDTGDAGSASPSTAVTREDEHRHARKQRDRDDRPNREGDNDAAEGEQQPQDDAASSEQQAEDVASESEQQTEEDEIEGDEAEGDEQVEDNGVGDEQQTGDAEADEAEGNEAAEPENTRKEKKLSLRKKLEAREAALRRNRPSVNLDRVTSKDRDERERGERKNGRADEETADERGEGRQKAKRPAVDRPAGNGGAPSEEGQTPEPPTPATASQERREPASEGNGEAPEAAKEPEPVETPNAGRETPTAEPPDPGADAVPVEPAGDVAAPESVAPTGEGPPSGTEVEAVPAVEAEVGEE